MSNPRNRTNILALIGSLFCLSLSFTIASAQNTPSWCVSVWYPSSDDPNGIESIRQNSDIIQVINPFWYTPNADNTLQPIDNAEDEALLTEWREAGVLIIPSIFASIPSMLTDATTRTQHIEYIIEKVEQMDYDGIDIDYEGFPLSTREAFSLFIEELSHRLHDNGRLLSIAVHAKVDEKGSWESAEAQDWTRIAPVVDVFGIMTYDYTSRNEVPGAISPIEWVDNVLQYAQSVTNLSKVRMGLPFYGYSWTRDKPPATTTSWASAQRIVESFQPEVQRDTTSQEARIDFKAKGLPKQTIIFADATAIQQKLAIILEKYPDLGGISIWGIGGEDPANWTVLRDYDKGDCLLTRP